MSLGKEALGALLKYHDDLYYNQDKPEISDYEYDALKNSYVELYGEYDYVPGEASGDSKKYVHSTPILSLDKVQITDEVRLREEIERLWPVIIQPKMDGLTLVTYPNNIHVTRGNGIIGEVVTDNVMAGVSGLGMSNHLTVRSEVVMLKSKFEELNSIRIANGEEPFKNPRNAAAGMLRQKNPTNVEGLTAFAYNTIHEEERNNSYPQILALETYGWNTVLSYSPETIEDAMEYIKNFNREELDYEIDGLVIKYDGIKQFGTTGHHPKSSIAVKFEAEGEWTQIHSITWQVGKTGQICPVAELEPVDIMGSTVSRATMHNSGIMKGLGLDYIYHDNRNKTYVYVVKANDVIPKIIQVRHDNPDGGSSYGVIIDNPKVCPECGAATELKNDILYCTGTDCVAQLAGKMQLMASRDALNIEGMSEATIEKIINFYNEHDIKTVEELDFTFPLKMHLEDIACLPGFADKSIEKLYNNIQKAKDTELKRFIYAANMPLIGRSASEAIANHVINIENLMAEVKNNFNNIAKLPDFGPKMIDSLRNNAPLAFAKLWDAGVRPKDVVTKNVPKLSNSQVLTFVITGSFDIPRKEIEDMIKNAGHKKSGSVSSKTSYLLASPGEESTSKYKKAIDLGIKIINSLDELAVIIN